jgi:hypothetical protein
LPVACPPRARPGADYERLERQTLLERVAELLADEKIVGWFNVVMMLLIGTLLVLAQGSTLAPFIYTIF